MAGNKAELGKTFLGELKSKLPDTLHSHVDTLLSSPEAQAALELAGSRVSPLDEERTQLQQLRTQLDTRETRLTDWHNRLEGWKDGKETEYTERERKLAEREAAGGNRSTQDPPPNPNPKPGDSSMTAAQIEELVGKILAPREAGYVQYVADATRFASFHLQNFKEPLDVAALVRHPQIGELGVKGVYELVHKDKIDAMTTAKAAADREALKQELRREIAGETPVDMPYPLGEGSPLDVLSMDPKQRPTGDPAAAARMYDQLVGGRT